MKPERRAAVDAPPGYRNGFGKPRRLALSAGTIEVRRPRVRGLEERFESRVLPLFRHRTREVGELISELCLHGLADGDFELALRWLLGDGAPMLKSSVGRLRARWTAEHEAWNRRSLASWSAVLRELKARGLAAPVLLVADGNLGVWGAGVGGVAGDGRAAVLEPQDGQRAGLAAEA